MKTNPNEIQHGGDHYKKAGGLQHWDMLAAFGYGWEYYVARASAYLTRVKDTALDPKKAVHFIDKLIYLIERGQMPAVFTTTQRKRLNIEPGHYGHQIDVDAYLADYYRANSIDPASDEARAIRMLSFLRTADDLREVRAVVARLADEDGATTPAPAPADPMPAPPKDVPAEQTAQPVQPMTTGNSGAITDGTSAPVNG